MKKVYLSAPISGHDIEECRKKFEAVESAFRLAGYDVCNPMKNGLPVNAGTYKHMKRDLEMLLECDYIYMMQGWLHSAGCKCEFQVATAIGLGVIFAETGKEIKFY